MLIASPPFHMPNVVEFPLSSLPHGQPSPFLPPPTEMSRIFHGKITGDPYRPAKSITSFDLDPAVNVGELVSRWNHYFVWDEACIPGKELEKLRLTGDDLCDEVVKFLGMGGGDMLVKLEAYMSSTPREKWEKCVREVLDEYRRTTTARS